MTPTTFAIASGGTTSDKKDIPMGQRLVGFILPALDSTTISVALAAASGDTFLVPYDASGSIAVCGPGANTGSRYITVPEALSLLTEGMCVQLTVAAQNGGARTLKGITRGTAPG